MSDSPSHEPGSSKTTLPSGLRIVTERMPEAASVSIGMWVGVGSRDEPDDLAGASHFLEHLLFKGTHDRSARDIAMAVDAAGGDMNAYTAREQTAFYVRLPAERLITGLELLSEVVVEPALRQADLDAERDVILEEIHMNEDLPDDLVYRELFEAVFPGDPLGRETLGTAATVEMMTRDHVAGFHERWYTPRNVVLAVAGRLDHDDVVEAARCVKAWADAGSDADAGKDPASPVRTAPQRGPVRLKVLQRPAEQAHVAWGWRSLDHDDPDRYALSIANHVLGGGMSSRLFEEVREQRGLAYSVSSSVEPFAGAGLATIYAATTPSRVAELFAVVDEVLAGIVEGGITEEEHAAALGYLEGSLVLGLEDSGSRMARLGAGEVVRGEVLPVAEHLTRLRAVAAADVSRALRRVFDQPASVSLVGPLDEDAVARGARSAARQ